MFGFVVEAAAFMALAGAVLMVAKGAVLALPPKPMGIVGMGPRDGASMAGAGPPLPPAPTRRVTSSTSSSMFILGLRNLSCDVS